MELKIRIVHDEGKESGIIHIHKPVGNELRKIGEMRFSDASDKRWLLMVMTDGHPNVSVLS